MSQYAFSGNTIINQSFPDTRTALNAAYAALASNSSGDNDPTSVAGGSLATVQHQWWYDSTNNKLMLRNDANNAWIEIATIDETSGNVLSITTQGLTLGATALTATGTEINQLDAITRGSILYGNASGATARLAKGAADTVLTSDGTDISWQAASSGGGGGRTLISTTTISNDATVLVEGLDSTYDHYQFVILDYLNATTTNALTVQYKSGGSIDQGLNYRYVNIGAVGGSTSVTANTASNSLMRLNQFNSASAPYASTIVFDIFNPAGTTYSTSGFATSILPGSLLSATRHLRTSNFYIPTTAVTGVQFLAESGNLGSGTIKLYGIS